MAKGTAFLIAACVVAWHGVTLSVPHNHAANAVPREELHCSASGPSSNTEHFHAAGRHLAPHPCLACLVGSTAADEQAVVEVEAADNRALRLLVVSADNRSSFHTHLPLSRGPPTTT